MSDRTPACPAVTRPNAWAAVPGELLATGSPRAVQVYALLARHANADGRAWPSEAHLSDDARCGLRTIERAVAELVELGAIAVVGRRATRGGAVNVYAVGYPQVAATGGGQLEAVAEVAATGGGPVAATGGGQNETHGNETHPARPRVCDTPPSTPPPRRGGAREADRVDELLERLPSRVQGLVGRRHRSTLRRQLERALEQHTLGAVVRHVVGNDWPPLETARNVPGALAHRLAAVADLPPPASSSGCHDCDRAALELLPTGDVLKACPDHRPTVGVAA